MTQLLGPAINKVDSGNKGFSSARVAAAAMVGGTVSAATGGKFANGAVTAAFSRAFNDEIRHNKKPEFNVPEEYKDKLPAGLLMSAYNDLLPLSGGKLEGGTIGYLGSSDKYTSIQMEKVKAGEISWIGSMKGMVYLTHTHGNSTDWFENYFSNDDTFVANKYNKPVFLATRRGDFRVYLPGQKTGRVIIKTAPDSGYELRGRQAEGILLCSGCMNTRE